MMTLEPIDLALYAKAPLFTVHRGISLIGVLLPNVPDPASDDVVYRTAQLRRVRDDSREALRIRHRELGPSAIARHVALDQLVDLLNRIRFERIEHWRALDCDAVQQLAASPDAKVDWTAVLGKARQAEQLGALLFPNGTDYTRLGYEEQLEHMQTITDIIAEDDSRAALDALVGPELLAALDEALVHYRQMIDDRLAHQRGSEVDLRTVHAALQDAIQRYMIAVLAMLREDDPDIVAMVRRALRPIDAVREQNQLERSRAAGKAIEPRDPEAVEELVAAERALELELGLGPVDERADADAAVEGEVAEPALIGG